MRVIGIRHLGGALAREPEIPNAVGHRDAAYSLTVLGEPEAQQTVLEPWKASTVGRFLNFSYAPLTADEVADGYDPGDYERLTELRRRYDPDRRLHVNHQL